MAWIESHQSLLNHPKTIAAQALLRVDRYKLLGHLHALWWWSLDVVDLDGRFPARCTDAVLAHAAGWPAKTASHFVSALTEVGFVDVDGDTRLLHDWYEYAGKLAGRRAANKERMASARAEHVQRTTGTRAAHVQGLPTNQPTEPTNQPDQPGSARDPVDQLVADFAAFGAVGPGTVQAIEYAVKDFGLEWLQRAVRKASGSAKGDPPPWSYVESILERWKDNGGPDESKRDSKPGPINNGDDPLAGLTSSHRAELQAAGFGRRRKVNLDG